MDTQQAIYNALSHINATWSEWDRTGYSRLRHHHFQAFTEIALAEAPGISVAFDILRPDIINDSRYPLSLVFSILNQKLQISLPCDVLSGAPDFRAFSARLAGVMIFLAHATARSDTSGLQLTMSLGDHAHGCDLTFSGEEGAHLVPDSEFLIHLGYESFRQSIADIWIPWKARQRKIFWRGSTTGKIRDIDPDRGDNWFDVLQRVKLCHIISNSDFKDKCDVGFSNIVQIKNIEIIQNINAHFLKPRVERVEQLNNRYHIDIDGNSNAWAGLFQALIMGSCILKVESEYGYKQWYYYRMVPWVHYIPVRKDLSDLVEKISWAFSHENECEVIAMNAANLAHGMKLHPEIASAVNFLVETFNPQISKPHIESK